MRLKKVERGRLRTRLLLGAMRLVTRTRAPDVLRTMLYRRELFGRPYSLLLHNTMRGPSDWSAGERELFAAFVSRQNQCPF